MTASGLEKFAHVVDKLHRSVVVCESLRHEKEQLAGELAQAKRSLEAERADKEMLKSQIEFLLKERESMKLRVEGILDAITMLELEAESAKK